VPHTAAIFIRGICVGIIYGVKTLNVTSSIRLVDGVRSRAGVLNIVSGVVHGNIHDL
jgi:hypothetical protein